MLSVTGHRQQGAKVIQRVWVSGRLLATSHTDDRFIVNRFMWNQMMNATQLQSQRKEVSSSPSQPIRYCLYQCCQLISDHLAWAREHSCWMRDEWASVLFTDVGHFALGIRDELSRSKKFVSLGKLRAAFQSQE